jgi:hypothetical protein
MLLSMQGISPPASAQTRWRRCTSCAERYVQRIPGLLMPKSLGQSQTGNPAVFTLEHAITDLSIFHPLVLAEDPTTLHNRIQWRDVGLPPSSKTRISGLPVGAHKGHIHEHSGESTYSPLPK